jgi:hypothetical protein
MRSLVLPLFSFSLLACASDGLVDELAGETPADEALDGKADGKASGVYTYFSIKGDIRKCAAPFCGGFFLERVNRSTTVCHDGKSDGAACYTPELDWSESGLSELTRSELTLAAAESTFADSGVRALVRGRFAPTGTNPVQPSLGRFIVTEAWIAQGDVAPEGVFVKVRDNGIRCITAPCPSLTETGLNTSRSVDIAEIDYAPSGLDDERTSELSSAMFEESGLIIAGERINVGTGGRAGKGRTATNVFVRLSDAATGACFVGGCSGQICSDQEGVISTCEWRDEYACYQQATCERQPDGACGWTPTAELDACLGN